MTDTRQRDDDKHARFLQPLVFGEQAMNARHADVVEPVDAVAHHHGCDGRLLGDRQV